jgi:hypothetical protein
MRWEFKRLWLFKEDVIKDPIKWFGLLGEAIYELFVQIPKECWWFVQKVWDYKSILWHDRDWDHAFILYMLKFKIERTRKHIGECARHTRWKLDVKNMKKAEDLINYHLSSKYDKIFEKHDEKWGKIEFDLEPTDNPSLSKCTMRRAKANTSEKQKQERKEYGRLLKRSLREEEKSWKKIWTHLDKHMRSWWD